MGLYCRNNRSTWRLTMKIQVLEIEGEKYYADFERAELSLIGGTKKRRFEKSWELLEWLVGELGEEWWKEFKKENSESILIR